MELEDNDSEKDKHLARVGLQLSKKTVIMRQDSNYELSEKKRLTPNLRGKSVFFVPRLPVQLLFPAFRITNS